jgi:hypothetical protein
MKKNLWMALAMLALAATAHAGGAKMSSVQQEVKAVSKDGKVIVTVSLVNGSPRPVYVPKAVFEDDELFARTFEVRDAATGAEVDYIGPMVKRAPFTRDDYLAVKPGARRSNSIDITRSFDFKPGRSYQIGYSGAYLHDLAKLDAGTTASSTAPAFTFSGK